MRALASMAGTLFLAGPGLAKHRASYHACLHYRHSSHKITPFLTCTSIRQLRQYNCKNACLPPICCGSTPGYIYRPQPLCALLQPCLGTCALNASHTHAWLHTQQPDHPLTCTALRATPPAVRLQPAGPPAPPAWQQSRPLTRSPPRGPACAATWAGWPA